MRLHRSLSGAAPGSSSPAPSRVIHSPLPPPSPPSRSFPYIHSGSRAASMNGQATTGGGIQTIAFHALRASDGTVRHLRAEEPWLGLWGNHQRPRAALAEEGSDVAEGPREADVADLGTPGAGWRGRSGLDGRGGDEWEAQTPSGRARKGMTTEGASREGKRDTGEGSRTGPSARASPGRTDRPPVMLLEDQRREVERAG